LCSDPVEHRLEVGAVRALPSERTERSSGPGGIVAVDGVLRDEPVPPGGLRYPDVVRADPTSLVNDMSVRLAHELRIRRLARLRAGGERIPAGACAARKETSSGARGR
jgi:hypothetical protein